MCLLFVFKLRSLKDFVTMKIGSGLYTAEYSTVEDSTVELYLPTTLRQNFSQIQALRRNLKNADSTAEF